MPDFDPYEVLKIPHGASGEEIEAAYRSMAERFGPRSDESPMFAALLARAVKAYEMLRKYSPDDMSFSQDDTDDVIEGEFVDELQLLPGTEHDMPRREHEELIGRLVGNRRLWDYTADPGDDFTLSEYLLRKQVLWTILRSIFSVCMLMGFLGAPLMKPLSSAPFLFSRILMFTFIWTLGSWVAYLVLRVVLPDKWSILVGFLAIFIISFFYSVGLYRSVMPTKSKLESLMSLSAVTFVSVEFAIPAFNVLLIRAAMSLEKGGIKGCIEKLKSIRI